MVQVDIAWAYGVGASFAVVAQRHLLAGAARSWREGLLTWPFLQVAFFGLFILTPLTAQLLWAHPRWQLMFVVGEAPGGWTVAGILVLLSAAAFAGYAVGWSLLRAGRRYAAYLQFLLGYFLLFFGVTYGWDGTGYQRLLSVDAAALDGWTWAQAQIWLESDIVADYNLQMLVLIPYLLYFASWWIARDARPRRHQLLVVLQLVGLVFGAILGTALAATVILLQLGPALGWPLVLAGLAGLLHPRYGLFGWLHRAIFAP